MSRGVRESDTNSRLDAIRGYWDENIPYLEIVQHPIGTKEFFEELETFRYEKLEYMRRAVNFTAFKEKKLLEVGCRLGLDLVQFARHGAIVTGVDLAEKSLELAKENFALNGVNGDLRAMDVEDMQFNDESFDVVYARIILNLAYDPERMIREIHRVLRPGGEAIFIVFNRYSWLTLLAKLSGKPLQHNDAPFFRLYSIGELRRILGGFSKVEITLERFASRTRQYKGLAASVYNTFFVRTYKLVPRAMVRPFGAHIIAKAIK